MSFSVNDLRTNLSLGGARPTLFDVTMTMPTSIASTTAMQKLQFTCQSSELPESRIGTINVPYFGRQIPYPGDRTFSPWRVGIINDEDFLIKDAMENWHTLINSRQGNVRGAASDDPNLVMGTAIVTQYNRTGKEMIRQYKFQHIWPSQVANIALDWGAQDTIETFPVEFNYAWWDVLGPTVNGNAS